MALSNRIKDLENLYNKNLNILSQALIDKDFIIENSECNLEDFNQAETIFLDKSTDIEDKNKQLISLLEKDKYIATFFLFSLNKTIDDNYNLKTYLNIGYKFRNPLITFLYGLYTLDLYSKNNKETDLLKAKKIFDEAYSLDVSIAKIPLENLEIFKELSLLEKKRENRSPVNQQITINDEKRNIYLFKGNVIDRKIVTSQSTEAGGGGNNGFGGSNPVYVKTETNIRTTFNIVDDYGNEKVYSHPDDIDIRVNNEVILINLDNAGNAIGIYNKDTGYAYYNPYKINKLTPYWFNILPLIMFFIGFFIFFNYWGWNYIYSITGILIAFGGILTGLIFGKFTEALRVIFNRGIFKKMKEDMWKILR